MPLQQAICTKNSNGDYCVLNIASGNSSSAAATTGESFQSISEHLYSDASSSDASQAAVSIVPNTTTFAQNNLLFLFLSPNLTSSELCTSCTRDIMGAYISFESDVPYAPGIASSALMSGQTDLYKGVLSSCGSSFMSGAAQAAGAISGGETADSGALSSMAIGTKTVGAVVGAAVLALVAML